MNKVPVLITILLSLSIGFVALWLPYSSLGLTKPELVSAEITLIATLGALISANFVVYSYLQTNLAFLEGKRPQLLVQLENKVIPRSQQDPTLIPVSLINYRNITQNQFNDLNIKINISSNNREVDISDLFKRNMTMIGHDFRIRQFQPIALLSERGLDITNLSENGHEVIMRIHYEFTFMKNKEVVHCQEYKWDPKIQQWIIP